MTVTRLTEVRTCACTCISLCWYSVLRARQIGAMQRRTLRSQRPPAAMIARVVDLPEDLDGELHPIPTTNVKRECESGKFSAIRTERGDEVINVAKLRSEIEAFLHPVVAGLGLQPALVYSTCSANAQAQQAIISALQTAAHQKNWHELWILLGQIRICVMSPGSNELPWWVLQHRQAGEVAELVELREDSPSVDLTAAALTSPSTEPRIKLELKEAAVAQEEDEGNAVEEKIVVRFGPIRVARHSYGPHQRVCRGASRDAGWLAGHA